MTGCSKESPYNVAVSCMPERGWVIVQAEATVELQNPVVELCIPSSEGRSMASTVVMDAPSSFRVTLHPRGVEVGMSLVLQVKLISTEDMSVELGGEYPIVFEAPQEM
jgi:hypothetical protein